jgi:cell division protein FtsB
MKFIKKFIWVVLLAVAGLSFVYLFLPDVAKHLDLSAHDKRISKKIEDEERKNISYKKEINDLESNPVYIEKVAREKLGLSRPEEIIYKFENNEQKPEGRNSAQKTNR